MEVKSLNIVVAKDREEELGKWRHQTGDNGAHEERIEGAPLALREGRAGLEHLRPVDALRRRHLAHPGKSCIRHIRRVQGGRIPGSGRGLARRHVRLGRAGGVDLEISKEGRRGARKGI